MIALAQQRVDGAQVQFVHANVRNTALEAGTYDLIVTHFFLDCFAGAELCEVVKKVAAAATVDASWLLADFHFPHSGWRRFHASLWIRAMYLFFRLTTGLKTRNLDDPSALLCESGFECVRQQQSRFGMIKSELWRRNA
jgi:ubiquinone/menaquinone biosynthesis C-methylase UbiE